MRPRGRVRRRLEACPGRHRRSSLLSCGLKALTRWLGSLQVGSAGFPPLEGEGIGYTGPVLDVRGRALLCGRPDKKGGNAGPQSSSLEDCGPFAWQGGFLDA